MMAIQQSPAGDGETKPVIRTPYSVLPLFSRAAAVHLFLSLLLSRSSHISPSHQSLGRRLVAPLPTQRFSLGGNKPRSPAACTRQSFVNSLVKGKDAQRERRSVDGLDHVESVIPAATMHSSLEHVPKGSVRMACLRSPTVEFQKPASKDAKKKARSD